MDEYLILIGGDLLSIHCCDEYLIHVQLKLDLFDCHLGAIVFFNAIVQVHLCKPVIMQVCETHSHMQVYAGILWSKVLFYILK